MVTEPAVPELELLIALTRDAVGLPRAVSTCSESLDRDLFTRLAKYHGLAGITTRGQYSRRFGPDLPFGVVAELRSAAVEQRRNTLRLSQALPELLNKMAGAGVQVIPYKGPVLAWRLYCDVAARPSSDLDLLIRPSDLPHARDCLSALGFQDGFGLRRTQQDAALRFGFEHSFVRGGLKVDLHWRIAPRWIAPSLETTAIFDRATPIEFYGRHCFVLDKEDELLALSVHAAQHEWTQLILLLDILQLLRTEPNWQLVSSRVGGDKQTQRNLLVCLALVKAVWGFAPCPWDARLARCDVLELSRAAQRRWTDLTQFRPKISFARITNGLDFATKVRFFVGLVLEPKIVDLQAVRLPPKMTWVYYVVRPIRLLWDRLRGRKHAVS